AGAALALTAAAATHAAPAAMPSGAVGCHVSWPVSTYDGTRQPATTTQRWVPCVTTTRLSMSETSIGVTSSGALFFSPAGDENHLAVSHDHGATWSLVAPTHAEQTALWNTVDPEVTVDRRTGRLFWVHVTGPTRTLPVVVDQSPIPPPVGPPLATAVAFAYGFQVYSSSDEGRTWTTADYRTAPITDWEKIVVGPPPAGAAQPRGYPDVAYVCGNSPDEAIGPGRFCYRSLDGGASFAPAGFVYPSASAPKACFAINSDTGAVADDGSLYQPITCADGAYIAVSHDEGSTYTWHLVAGAPGSTVPDSGRTEMTLDDAGNLYAAWLDAGRVRLSVSRDGARTWSAPRTASPPQLHQIALPAVVGGPAGHVGLTYYGSAAASGPMAAFLTQTLDGLDPDPVFTTASLEEPGHTSVAATGLASGTPRADYIGATYDPDGVLWAAVDRQTGPAGADGLLTTVGVVGRLAQLGAPGPTTARPPAKHRREPHVTTPGGSLAATGLDVGALGGPAVVLLGTALIGIARLRRRRPAER
ncbi:MAG TPA: sialidase family protein, partial [Mycobacteriales bacterium]|nr:sialidase family protein [Mycobacteriales bacterium]